MNTMEENTLLQVGVIDLFCYKVCELINKKRKKSIFLIVDRNIISGLHKFCQKGRLRDKCESQIL